MVGCEMEGSFDLFSSTNELYFVYLGRMSSIPSKFCSFTLAMRVLSMSYMILGLHNVVLGQKGKALRPRRSYVVGMIGQRYGRATTKAHKTPYRIRAWSQEREKAAFEHFPCLFLRRPSSLGVKCLAPSALA